MKEKTQLRKMEELDAKVDKINYDLIGLENRKKEMEDKKASYQKEIDKLVAKIKKQMHTAAAELNFELAAQLRDQLLEIKKICE